MVPSIDVVVLTRQRRSELVRALDSVAGQLSEHDTLTVLENGCPEHSTCGLDGRFPHARFLRIDENLGVCGGRNRLIESTKGQVAFFLDDDATLEPGALAALRRVFVERDELGAVACRIDDPATGQPRPYEFPARVVTDIGVEREVTYFVGAGFALRRAAIAEVGPFDEALFYAGEELDLSYRLIDAGWRIRYVPAARVAHRPSPAGRTDDRHCYFNLRNRFRVAARNLPWRFALSQMVLWTGYFVVTGVRDGRVVAVLRGLRDGLVSLPTARRQRRAISADTVRYLEEHGGRLWF